MATFLALQTVFQFSRVSAIHRIALPNEFPGSLAFGPFGPTAVVLFDSSRDIVGHPDVKLSLAVLNDVNAISHREMKKIGCGGWI